MKTSRRDFIEKGLKATALATLGTPLLATAAKGTISRNPFTTPAFQFSQVALPYAYNALEPYIDAQTMEIHYTKHHAAYVKNVNDAIAAESINYNSEKDFFSNASKLSPKAKNNAGGVWNH